MRITLKTAGIRHALIEGLFAIMTEWGMSEVVSEGNGLHEVGVKL